MVGRVVCVLAVVSAAVIACSGDDKNEGGSCGSNSDCGGNLICQPVQGRKGDFCCPTPPTSSSQTNCHPSS